MKRPKTTQKFIEEAIVIHGYRYDYSLVDYKMAKDIIYIICNKHNYIFKQIANDHLRGCGCDICGGSKRKTTEQFIEEAIAIHGYKYDYSLVNYINDRINISIKCISHDYIFNQSPGCHLRGQGCPSCAITGFDQNKSGYYYYIRFDNPNYNSLYKVGVTNKTISARIRTMRIQKYWIPVILQQIYFKNGADALALETSHKQIFKEFKYNGEPIMVNGNSELFTKNILEVKEYPLQAFFI